MEYTINFAYLVPSDQSAVQAEIDMYDQMRRRLRRYFAKQSGGTTFKNVPVEVLELPVSTSVLYTGSIFTNLSAQYAALKTITDVNNTYNQQNRHVLLAAGNTPEGYTNSSNLGGTGGIWYRRCFIEKGLFDNSFYASYALNTKPIRAIAHEMGHLIGGFGHIGTSYDSNIMNVTAGQLYSQLEENDFSAGQKETLANSNFLQYPAKKRYFAV